ncbi:hypothetical protein KJ865_06745, partial [Myxococcota bacterium]|nr:hypothetical protein [Myxococcota bacterium]
MSPLSRPTLLLWFFSVAPFVVLAFTPPHLPYSDAALLGQCYRVLAIVLGVFQLAFLMRAPRLRFSSQLRLHFAVPLVTVTLFAFVYGGYVGLTSYDRLWYFVECLSLLLWSAPFTWHLGIKLGVYRREKSHRALVSHLVVKSIAILEVSMAAGFFTHRLLVDTPPEMMGSLLIINLLIQIPLLIPLVAFAVRLGRPLQYIFDEKWEQGVLAVAFRRAQLFSYLLITLSLL